METKNPRTYRKAGWLVVLLLTATQVVHATTYYTRASGAWNVTNTWSTASCGGATAAGVPGAGDDVIICAGHTVDMEGTRTVNDITISGASAILNVASGSGWPQSLTAADVYIDDGGAIVDNVTYQYVVMSFTNLYVGTNTSGATTQSVTLDNTTNNTYQISISGTLEVGNCNGDGTSTFSLTSRFEGAGNGANTYTIGTRTIHSSGATYTCSPTESCCSYAPSCPGSTTSPTCGTKYYVNDGSTSGDRWCSVTGDDSQDGLSTTTPKLTLADIFNDYDLGPFDTVFIDHGSYSWAEINWHSHASNDFGTGVGSELVIMGAGNGSGSYDTDISAAGSHQIFDFDNANTNGYDYIKFLDMNLTAASGQEVFYIGLADYITVDGCIMTAAASPNGVIHLYNTTEYITITDNEFIVTSGKGVYCEQQPMPELQILRNKFYGTNDATATYAVHHDQQVTTNFKLHNNAIYGFQRGLFWAQSAGTGSEVYNNSFYCRDECIYGDFTNFNIRNNSFYAYGGAAGDYCVYFSNATSPTMDYNNFYYPSAKCGYRGGTDYDTFGDWQNLFSSNDANSSGGDIDANNPDYASTTDLSITASSPLASAGIIDLVSDDIDGTARNDGSNDAIGAYEQAGNPTLALTSANPATAAASVCAGTTKHEIYAFDLAITKATVTLNQIDFTTTNSAAADITKYQLWYSTTDDLSGAAQIGSDITTSLGTGTHSFTGLTQATAAGNTAYLWITVDFAGGATVSNTLSVSSTITTGDITIASGDKSGTAFAGGTQTISAGISVDLGSDIDLPGDALVQINSQNATGTYAAYNGTQNNHTATLVSGGTQTVTTGDAVTISKTIINPAPSDVYQQERYETMEYQIDGFCTDKKYWLRLHFLERLHNSSGSRVFDVSINGTLYEDDYDVYDEVGHDVATVKEYYLEPNASGNFVINLTTVVDNAIIMGIEVYEAATLTATGGGTYLWSTGQTDASIGVPAYDSTYTVTVTNGGCSATDNVTISTSGKSWTPSDDESGQTYYGEEVVVTANAASTTGTVNYTWTSTPSSFGGTSATSTGTVTGGPSAVCVTITDDDGPFYGTHAIDVSVPYSDGATNAPDADGADIPGEIYAYNFNTGTGEDGAGGIDYDDSDDGNNGSQYRTGDEDEADIQTNTDPDATTYNVGWVVANEWLAYTVNVASTGYYNIDYRCGTGNFTSQTFKMQKYDGAGSWSDIANTTATVANTGGWDSWADVEVTDVSLTAGIQTLRFYANGGDINISKFDFTAHTLPVEMGKFSAECEDGYADIHWETFSEVNNDYFAVQKSADGVEYEDIAIIQGQGTSTVLTEYDSQDYIPYPGGTHYRIVQVDFDGASETFPSIYLPDNCDEHLLEPKVAALYQGKDGQVHLFFKSHEYQDYEFMLANTDGQVIETSKGTTTAETTHLAFNANDYTPGIYYFVVVVEEQRISQKLYIGRK